jgi:hypothetical protein
MLRHKTEKMYVYGTLVEVNLNHPVLESLKVAHIYD